MENYAKFTANWTTSGIQEPKSQITGIAQLSNIIVVFSEYGLSIAEKL